MNNNQILAELMFPNIDKTPEDYELKYPPRNLPEGSRVTRFAPSPTGFLHIGGLFTALIDKISAERSGGEFYIRIEDTDKKREVEGGIENIIRGLSSFGIETSEGALSDEEEAGNYGPYRQSRRKEIYQAYVKRLVSEGNAYPCFCSENELNDVREVQEKEKALTGYYGKWAKCRSLDFERAQKLIKSGASYAVRLRSPGAEDKKIAFNDLIKGKIEMPENIQDTVIQKADGIPTYHFAHVIDDHLMRSSLIIRGDEWISSTPIHLQMCRVLGFKPFKYAHVAPIMIDDNGSKRKLSKRKDPEAALDFYISQGYPRESVIEYLMTISNSNYEDWRRANPKVSGREFPFSLKKMSQSGALFDLAKLTDVSKNVISEFTSEEVYEQAAEWSKQYNSELHRLLTGDPSYAKKLFSIDRGVKNPRKDIAKWSEVINYVEYFYDELMNLNYDLPDNISFEDAAEILEKYIDIYDPEDEKDVWFAKFKALCPELGYTPNVKEFKKSPGEYKGHVGDLTTTVRIAITGRVNSPDLYYIMKLLGKSRVIERLNAALIYFKEE